MTSLRYPRSAIISDYMRAGVGLVLTLGPLLLVEVADVLVWILGGLAVLFGWFGWRTFVRHGTRVDLSAQTLRLRGPHRHELAWSEIQKVGLAYYAPRRGSGEGWLQLTLRGAGGPVIRIESSLEGFETILSRVRSEVARREIDLDAATEANLEAIAAPPRGHSRS